MQFNKLFKISSVIILSLSSGALASDYPKTREEKIAEEMGSLAGDEGVVFRPSHMKNEETKAPIKGEKRVNRFLWEAAREVIKFMPTSSYDYSSGTIITDWYSSKNEPNYSFKIAVTITDNVISADALEVNVYEKRLKNGQWYNEPVSEAVSNNFADQILRKARELYIKSKEAK